MEDRLRRREYDDNGGAPDGGVSGGDSSSRTRGEDLLRQAHDAINNVLSGDSLHFNETNRQGGGQ